MNSPIRDSVALGCCIAMGLAISTGHPIGMIAATGMPVACLISGRKKAALKGAMGYYLAALWPMISGLERYLGQSATFLAPVAAWMCGAIILSISWTVAATEERGQYIWRAPLALIATIVPPLGIIGVASPLTAAGYLFPGTEWIGLAAVAFVPGIVLVTPALPGHGRCIVWCSVISTCIALAIAPRLFGSFDVKPPRGWIAVNTHFGDVSQPFRDFAAAQFIQETAAKSTARVLIFPEAVVPRWSEATEAFWLRSLDRFRRQSKIIAFGAGLPRSTLSNTATLANLYDFGPALEALKGIDKVPAHFVPPSHVRQAVDNALVIAGAESAEFYQRVPVPIGMWQPFNRASVPLHLRAPGILSIDHQRAAVLICYEQMLTFPILASMLQHPTVIVGISNTFWVADTSIPRYQANAVRAWARLFGLPYLLAVNS
jgi:hypothetical protein